MDGVDLVDRGDPFDAVTPIAPARPPAVDDNPWRKQAMTDAKVLWSRSGLGHRGIVRPYLLSCGINLQDVPDCLRFALDHPYVKKIGGEYQVLHRGPCMTAAIHAEGGQILGVHQTWVDIEPPHGRAVIQRDGKALPAEMVRGSKAGGFVPLVTPAGSDALVMGPSIEVTLRAFAARPPGFGEAAFWSGVDLKNMAGKMLKEEGVRYSGIPDLEDPKCFVPPHWVKRLVFLQVGDSAAERLKLECGLQRAMEFRQGLRASIVRVG